MIALALALAASGPVAVLEASPGAVLECRRVRPIEVRGAPRPEPRPMCLTGEQWRATEASHNKELAKNISRRGRPIR